jgi:hypothetical protein
MSFGPPLDPPPITNTCCENLQDRTEYIKKNLLILIVIVAVIGVLGVWGLIHGFVVSDRVQCLTQKTDTLITQIGRERSDSTDVDTKNAAANTQQLVVINTYLDPNATADQKLVAVDAYAKDLSTARGSSLVAAQHRVDDQLPDVDCQ